MRDQHDEFEEHPTPGEAWGMVRSAAGSDLRGGWPLGKRARARRQELRRRRSQLRAAATAPSPARRVASPQEITPRRNAAVIATGVGIVASLLALGYWASSGEDQPPRRALPQVPAVPAPAPPTSSAPTVPPSTGGSELGPVEPIPPGGVAPIAPRPHKPKRDPATVAIAPAPTAPPSTAELASPELAGMAWMARWCPFNSADAYGTAELRAKPAMTELGWSEFAPSPAGQESWNQRVATAESAQCSAPRAEIHPAAPRSATSAIVRISADQVVTGRDGTYVETLQQQRIVKLDPDGAWRVDTATSGG